MIAKEITDIAMTLQKVNYRFACVVSLTKPGSFERELAECTELAVRKDINAIIEKLTKNPPDKE